MKKAARGSVGWFLLLLTVGLFGCGSAASFRLPLSVTQAPRSFAPLASCAAAQSLTAIEHPTSVNVRFDPSTWIQYMIQGEQYNMVIVVGNDVPPDQRQARTSTAKTKGDELFSCAMSQGLSMPPPVVVVASPPPATPEPVAPPTTLPSQVIPPPATAPIAAPPSPALPPPATAPIAAPPPVRARAALCKSAPALAPRGSCASAKGSACTQDANCPSNNCTRNICQSREPGSPCTMDAQCNSNNCTGGCCHAREVGGHCSENAQCNTNNCTNGICQNREPGSPCTADAQCNTNNCTDGCCNDRTPGARCREDLQCNTNNCRNGVCQ